MKRKIGIIGTGNVGKTLAAGFLRHGYQVMLGSRSQEKLLAIKGSLGESLKIGTVQDAVGFADVVVLAVKGIGAKEAVLAIGADALAGKVVIDTTNPIADVPPVKGVFQYFTDQNNSLMEQLQGAAPQARFVKAWSSVGYVHMVNPQFPDGKPTMFICGNDQDAKQVVSGILDEFGWGTEDVGAVESARAVEALGRLWCIDYLRSKRTNHAFKLIRN